MSDHTLLVRMFLRDCPQFIPDVTTGVNGEPVFNELSVIAFQRWADWFVRGLSIREARQLRDFFDDRSRDRVAQQGDTTGA